MKVNGPSQSPAPGVSGPEGTGAPSGVSSDKAATEPGKSFAEKVSGPRPTDPAAAVGAGGTVRKNDMLVGDIATDLRTGKLTSRAAVDKVMEGVIARQVGPEAPQVVRDRVRAALQDAIENDPLLADKLRQLA